MIELPSKTERTVYAPKKEQCNERPLTSYDSNEPIADNSWDFQEQYPTRGKYDRSRALAGRSGEIRYHIVVTNSRNQAVGVRDRCWLLVVGLSSSMLVGPMLHFVQSTRKPVICMQAKSITDVK